MTYYPKVTDTQIISAASTNATSVKASSCQMFSIVLSNSNAAARYVKFYDKASAPVVGTDTPIMTIMVPANGTLSIFRGENGTLFANGLALAITAGAAVTDVAAVGLNDVIVNLNYTV